MGRAMIQQHEIEFRVRYQETDAQGHVHHANYLTYFEMGRTELMRAAGQSYRDFETAGFRLVVSRVQLKYAGSAKYDDLLRLRTTTKRVSHVRIDHQYQVFRGEELIAAGETTLACIDGQGKIRRLPDWMRATKPID